ncbi:MAG: PAS domain S-box protein [Ignavibacteriae bacterium]|nr:PAS domain S-box protein [Ignavibacteriota bacterium]
MSYVPTMDNQNEDKLNQLNQLVRELQSTKQDLEDRERRLRLLIDLNPDCVKVVSPDGTILDMNPAGLAILEADSLNDVKGQPVESLISPNYRAPMRELLGTVLSGTSARLKFEVVGLKGTARWLEMHAVPIHDDDKNVKGILSITRDITGRLRAEEELRQSEEHYRSLMEQASVGIYIADDSGRYVNVNPAGCQMLGYTKDELCRMSIADLIPPEDLKATPVRLEELRAGKTLQSERRLRRKDGSLVTVEINAKKQADGLFQAFARDITARKHAEAALRESEERTRTMIDNVRDVIFTVGTNGILTSLNEAFEKITGWSRSEWIGKSFTSLVHPDDLSLALQTYRQSLRGEQTPLYQLRIVTRTRQYLVGEFKTAPSIVGGTIAGVIGIVRDVTERISLEEQLRRAQKLESLGTLAGGVAHDFNNILGIILGHTSLLQRFGGKSDKAEMSLDAIGQAVQRGSGLVRQLLTFARTSEVVFESANVNTVVKDFIKMFHATFPKSIALSLQLHDHLQPIRADVNQLHQVLLNLTVNARDAMPKGGTLTVHTEEMTRAQVRRRFPDALECQYVSLSMTDTGTGMDEATRRRIFEPFFTTKGEEKGTGLGLSVVYGIIKSHSGIVEVESTPGVGTTFRLFFPVREDAKAIAPTTTTEQVANSPGGTETILLVEDEEMLRTLVKTLLEAKGYVVITAENGLEAVEQYKQFHEKISVVVTDIGLPRLGGWDAFLAMKKIDQGIKAIFASGYLDPNLRDEIVVNGGKHFIQKPYVPAELLKIVRKTIENGRDKDRH